METEAIMQEWLEAWGDRGGTVGKGLDHTTQQARHKATQYVELGTAYDDFQPGNGTSYAMVLHDLVRAQMPTDEQVGVTEADLREWASSRGPTARWGGELLIAMPAFGRSAVIGLYGGLLTPDFVGEQLKLGSADAVHIAIYLTLFGEAVMDLREGT